ncbi:MAG: hypothetical protein RL172_1133 [Bacteroidota bacterium]|jgi:NADPH:quinone reductase-like Zn-dependent oxidoreductase
MKAVILKKYSSASNAFNIIDVPIPAVGTGQVLIKVACFGLNFADVMARVGMYKEAPPLPAVLGYDVAGTVEAIGAGVTHVAPGDKVFAMTRFGGYAEYALTQAEAVAKIPAGIDMAAATALATQYCTAYYAAAAITNLYKGDNVLIHAGAGGVGMALLQLALHKGCQVFSTAGSDEKVNMLKAMGVHHPINYNNNSYWQQIRTLTGGKGIDVIFDAVGGGSVNKGFKQLAPGGRIICYGAATMSNKNIFGKIGAALAFGFYHPVMLMTACKSMIGINMLRIADEKPAVLQQCLQQVVALTDAGIFKPVVGKVFKATDIAAAHDFLGNRMSTGKIVMQW